MFFSSALQAADPVSCVHSLRQIKLPEIDLRMEQERISNAINILTKAPQYRGVVRQYGEMTNNKNSMGVGEIYIGQSYPFYSEVMEVKRMLETSSEDISLKYYFDFRTKLFDSILDEKSLLNLKAPMKLIGMYRGLWYLSVLEARIDPKEREDHQKAIEEKLEEEKTADELEQEGQGAEKAKQEQEDSENSESMPSSRDSSEKQESSESGKTKEQKQKKGMDERPRDEYEDHVKDPGLQEGSSENTYVIFIDYKDLQDLDRTPYLAANVFEAIHSQKFQKSFSLRANNREYPLGYFQEIGSAIFLPKKGITEISLPMHKDLEILTGDYGDFRVKKLAEREFVAIAKGTGALPSKLEVKLTSPPQNLLDASQFALLTQKSSIEAQEWPEYLRSVVEFYARNSNLDSFQKVDELAKYFVNSRDFTYSSVSELGKAEFEAFERQTNQELRQSGNKRALVYANQAKFNCDGASRLFATLVRDFFNLPTRIVGGRSLRGQIDIDGVEYLVSAENDPFHAWVEVYIDGKWQSFEVTPKDRAEKEQNSDSNSNSDGLKSFQEDQKKDDQSTSKEGQKDQDNQAQEDSKSNKENNQNNNIKENPSSKSNEEGQDSKPENKNEAMDSEDANSQEKSKSSNNNNGAQNAGRANEQESFKDEAKEGRQEDSSENNSKKESKASSKDEKSDFLEQEKTGSTVKDAQKITAEELAKELQERKQEQDARLEQLKKEQQEQIEEANKALEEKKKEIEAAKKQSSEDKDGKDWSQTAEEKDKAFDEKNKSEKDKSVDFKSDVNEKKLEKFPDTTEGIFLAAGVAEKLRSYFHKGSRKQLNDQLSDLFMYSPEKYKSAYMKVKAQVRTLTENMWSYSDKSFYDLYTDMRREPQRHMQDMIYLLRHMSDFLKLIRELSPLSEAEQKMYEEIQKIQERATEYSDPNAQKLEATERFVGEMNGPLTKALVENMLGGAKDYLKSGSVSNEMLFDWLKSGKLSAIDQANLIAKYYPFVTDGEMVYTQSKMLNLLKAPQRDEKNDGIVNATISGFARWLLDPEPSLDPNVALFSKFARGEQKQRGYLKHDMVTGRDKQNEKKVSILYFDISGSMGTKNIPRILASTLLAFVDKALSERDEHGRSLHHVYIFPFGNRVHVEKGIYIENVQDAALLLRHFVENATQASEGTEIQACYDHFLDTVLAKFKLSRKTGNTSELRFTKANMFLLSDGDDSKIDFDAIKNSVQNLPKDVQVLFNLVSFGKENDSLKRLAAATNGDRPTMHNFFDSESMEKLINETQVYNIDERAFRPMEFDNFSWFEAHDFEIALNEMKNRTSKYQDYKNQIKQTNARNLDQQNIPPDTLFFFKELKERYPANQLDYMTREIMAEAVLKNYRRVNGRELDRVYEVELNALMFFDRWVQGEK